MAIYSESTLGAVDNYIVFNDFDYLHTAGILFRMKHRMPNKREVEEFDIPLPEQSGVADFQTFIGKSYLVLEGTMYPDDELYFDKGRDLLRQVSSVVIEQADANSDSGYVPYSWAQADGSTRQMFVKVLYVDIPESDAQGIVQPFRILCKIKQPVIYSGSTVGGQIGVSSPPVSSGNSGLSFGLPVLLGANLYTYTGTFTNAGALPTFPTFNIIGPCNVPRITNNNTGEYIEVNVNLGGTDTLNITYDEDSVAITLNGNSVYNKLSSGSTLFKVKPGDVSFNFTGSSVSTGSSATVSFYSAWPLS